MITLTCEVPEPKHQLGDLVYVFGYPGKHPITEIFCTPFFAVEDGLIASPHSLTWSYAADVGGGQVISTDPFETQRPYTVNRMLGLED